MSELPDNWEEIKSDKAFWDKVKRMIAADELHEAQYYEEATKRLTSGAEAEFDEEEYSAEEYDYELHELAIAAVINSKHVFSVFYNDQYGEDSSSSVNELAGKFYVADWSDPKMVIGPNNTIEDAATVILSCYDDGTFTSAESNLPIDRMLKLCEQAVPMGGEFGVNGVKYVMTKDGLVPA
jgi:hypothetical protein